MSPPRKTAQERAAARKEKARERIERRRARSLEIAQKQKRKRKKTKPEHEAARPSGERTRRTASSWVRMLVAVAIIVTIAAFVMFVVAR